MQTNAGSNVKNIGGAMSDGWSVTGTLCTGGVDASGNPTGQVAPIPYPVAGITGVATTTPEVSLQSKFEKSAGGPGAQYFTLEFNVTPPKSGYFFALAEVTWSTEGNEVRRLISLVNGAVISGTAQFAKVRIFDNTVLNASFPTPEIYKVSALITPGCRPSQQQPPRLRGRLLEINFGATLDVPIPQDAGVISANLQRYYTAAPASGHATFLSAGGAVALSAFDLADAGPADFIPVPPGATILRIANTSGAANLLGGITWGIEG